MEARDGDLLAGQYRRTALMALPRVGSGGRTRMAPPTQPGHLILQENGAEQHAQFEHQALHSVLHQSEQLIAIQGELDLPAGGHDGDRRLG
jgi:hypothetical protein